MSEVAQNGKDSRSEDRELKETSDSGKNESEDGWVDPDVDYLALMDEIRSKWGEPNVAVDGKLEAIDRAVAAMVSQSYALARRSEAEAGKTSTSGDDGSDARGGDSLSSGASTMDVAPKTGPDTVTKKWDRRVEFLYDDVLYLFQCADTDGALISLERLLLIAPDNSDIQAFISVNEKKLLEVYGRVLGSFDLVPERNDEVNVLARGHMDYPRFAEVLEEVKGEKSIKDLFQVFSWSPLETCAVLSQLQRCRLIITNPLQRLL